MDIYDGILKAMQCKAQKSSFNFRPRAQKMNFNYGTRRVETRRIFIALFSPHNFIIAPSLGPIDICGNSRKIKMH
jgi:hypothetical protein